MEPSPTHPGEGAPSSFAPPVESGQQLEAETQAETFNNGAILAMLAEALDAQADQLQAQAAQIAALEDRLAQLESTKAVNE